MFALFALFSVAFSQNVAKEDITLRDALRRLKGSFVLLGLKAQRGLDRAFGPVLQPVWKILGFAFDVLFRLVCAFVEAAAEAFKLLWNFLMQSIKRMFVWYRTRKLPKNARKPVRPLKIKEPEQVEPEQVEPEPVKKVELKTVRQQEPEPVRQVEPESVKQQEPEPVKQEEEPVHEQEPEPVQEQEPVRVEAEEPQPESDKADPLE